MAISDGVSAAGAVSAALAQKEVYAKGEVQVGMLKKAMDVQAEAALTLLDGIAPVPAQHLPANLGQNVNTTA
ncbi:YjfB family protein [Thiomicrospira microaerophila]|uniref:YjfB family protein n=1 Tax=Thiomicrospira microaerophila TaxID=406020 RepID=UPI00200E7AC6|nr:YjfB family protein [Thiomicrospira microaerophila]UQB41723.1 YjfB family protein [Thiomicrospira microaerophila]